MANTNFYVAPSQTLSGTTGLTFAYMGEMGSLATALDTLNIYFDYQLKVTDINSFIDNVVKSGTTDTVTKEFRTSTDGSTWSAYAALTNGNLNALTPNADNLFYINIRYTRTGASVGGFVSIQGLAFYATIDPDGNPVELWTMNNMNTRAQLKTFFPQAFNEYVYQFNGGNHYEVKYNDRYTCTVENKPVIYFYNLNISGDRQMVSGCSYRQTVQMNIGIKRRCDDKGYNEQLNQLVEMFNPYTASRMRYNIFGHFGATLSDFGILNVSSSGMIELRDAECQCEMNEFVASFDINFSTPNLYS